MYLALIRVALGLAWVVAARISGASSTSAWLAFATAAFAIVFLYFNDPRARFRPAREAKRVSLLGELYPGTIGLSVLAAIAVYPQPILASFLGGISAGLGLAGAGNRYLGTLFRR